MPHGKAIAPASVKAVSPTPSQTQVCSGLLACVAGRLVDFC